MHYAKWLRTLCVIGVLCFQAGLAWATPESGIWWNPAQSGRGFVIEVQGSSLFFGAFLYEANGRSTWYASSGPLQSDGSYQGSLQSYGNGQTLTGAYQASTVTNANAGNVTLAFSDAKHGTITWPGGTMPIERFTFGSGTPSFQPESGIWWNAAESGRGFLIEVQGSSLWMGGYMYDSAGNPVWYSTSGPVIAGVVYVGEWDQYSGGQTLTGAYTPPAGPTKAGSVALQFNTTTTATLTLPDSRQIQLTRFNFGTSGGTGGTGGTVSLPPLPSGTPMTAFSPVSDTDFADAVTQFGALLKANYDASILGGWSREQKAANALAAIQSASATIPGFYDAGLTPDKFAVWVRLKDGTPIGQFDSRSSVLSPNAMTSFAAAVPPASSVTERALLQASPPKDGSPSLTTQAGPGALLLPAQQRAVVAYMDTGAPMTTSQLPGMLANRGYQVQTIAGPSIAYWRSVFADGSVGVAWFLSHVTFLHKNDGTFDVGMQATPLYNFKDCPETPDTCALNRSEISAGLLVAACDEESGNCSAAITGDFMKKYWKFPTGALVFLNFCTSGYFFPYVNADTLLGWTGYVDASFSDSTSLWFFDRVLGANTYQPNTPKQRPFSAPVVYSYMAGHGLTTDPSLEDPKNPASGHAQLMLGQMVQSSETILVPSLRNMQVDEAKQELSLFGEFGGAIGTVTIGGTARQPNSWSDRKITLPVGPADGGPVVVKVNGITGNAVPLTHWTLSNYTARQYQATAMGTSSPGPYMGATCNRVQFRGDIHSYRLAPEETPHPGDMSDTGGRDTGRVQILNVIKSSQCASDTGGSGISLDGESKFTLSLPTTQLNWVPSDGNTYPPPWFFGEFRMYPETLTFGTCLNSAVAAPTKIVVVNLKTGETSESDWGSSTSAVCAATLTKSWPLGRDFNVNLSKHSFDLGAYGPGDVGELTINGGSQTNPDPSTIPTNDTEG